MGQFTQRVKDHLKRNWKKYALAGAAAYGYNKVVGFTPEAQKAAVTTRKKVAKKIVDTIDSAKKYVADQAASASLAAQDFNKQIEQAKKEKENSVKTEQDNFVSLMKDKVSPVTNQDNFARVINKHIKSQPKQDNFVNTIKQHTK